MDEHIDQQANASKQTNLIKSLVEARSDIQPPEKKSKGQHGNKYTPLDELYKTIVPPLLKHGLYLCHTTKDDQLITTIYHTDGGAISNALPLPADPSQCSNQVYVATLTYIRRAAIVSLLALPGLEDDDSGLAEQAMSAHKKYSNAPKPKPLNNHLDAKQSEFLIRFCSSKNMTVAQAAERYGVSVKDITPDIARDMFGFFEENGGSTNE